jgi:hypothetical protein
MPPATAQAGRGGGPQSHPREVQARGARKVGRARGDPTGARTMQQWHATPVTPPR